MEEIEESYLSNICKQARIILESNDYMIAKCKDTKKGTTDPFIKTEALEPRHLIRDYTCSVYHTCKEVNIEDKNGLMELHGLVYLDFHRKLNKKDSIVLDELDKFVHTALQVLFVDTSINGSCESFNFFQKQLWKVNPDSKTSDKMAENKVLDYICQVTLLCKYTYDYRLS